MKIIVVDNINWSKEGFSYPEIEAFISYHELPISWAITECEKHINKDVCYLINVHCVFNTGKEQEENTLLQNQSGVDFYRHLLNLYSEKEKKLKVAFFSPLPLGKLLGENQKPENEILNAYPFIEVPTEWKEFVTKIFSINESNWASFNNASENLLSGWALSDKEEINSSDKKIVFIDDQNEQWKTSLENIFSKTSQSKSPIEILPYNKEAEPKGEFSLSKLDASFKTKVKQADLIISDFYLEENHEINYWMNKKELEQKSGFKLFNEIKKENKGVPVVMHTSSNKISYYKIFDSYGIDNWFIKDVRPDSSKEEKKENYLTLKKSLEEILSNDYYKILGYYWEQIKKVENLNSAKWWFTANNNRTKIQWDIELADIATKELFVQILKSSWFAIRRLINREEVFEEIYANGNNGFVKDSFTANAVCSNLAKIIELLNINSGDKGFSLVTNVLINMRNASSHATDYTAFNIDDAIIFMDYLLKILNFTGDVTSFSNNWKDTFIKRSYDKEGLNQFEYSLFWVYLQFHKEDCSKDCLKHGFPLLEKRLQELFYDANTKGFIATVKNKTADLGKLNIFFKNTRGSNFKLVRNRNQKFEIEIN